MTDEQARDAMKHLLEEYVEDSEERVNLIRTATDISLPFPPVRNVVDNIFRLQKKELNAEDRELVSDLFHYFG